MEQSSSQKQISNHIPAETKVFEEVELQQAVDDVRSNYSESSTLVYLPESVVQVKMETPKCQDDPSEEEEELYDIEEEDECEQAKPENVPITDLTLGETEPVQNRSSDKSDEGSSFRVVHENDEEIQTDAIGTVSATTTAPQQLRNVAKKSKKAESDYCYDSEEIMEIEEIRSSDEDWKPTDGDKDHDFGRSTKKKRRTSAVVNNRKRRRISYQSSGSNNNNRALVTTLKSSPRPSPLPIRSINGKTPSLTIKPLQIPLTLIRRSQTFLIKQQGSSRIQVIPKVKQITSASLRENIRKRQQQAASRRFSGFRSFLSSSTNSQNKKNKNRSPASSSIDSVSEPETSSLPLVPRFNLQHCANCHVKFTKSNTRISHFRLNGERMSASDAFQKIFQLQLQKHKRLACMNMNQSAALCTACGQMIAKIYGAVYEFTKVSSKKSYFHQVSANAMKTGGSNGSFYDIKSHGARRSVQVATEPIVTHDKSTNYPVEDLIPYRPQIPTMPIKLEDYSRVSALCDICGKGLTKESGLKTHLLLTHSISQEQKSRDFVCGICGKAYFFQYLLKNHQAVHSDDKPFSCPKENCTATFKSRASLRTHRIEVHELREQGQSFDCKFCDKKYLRPRDLRDHTIARHSDQPMFECPYCHRFFQRKKNIRTHKCSSRPPPSDIKPANAFPVSGNEESSSQPGTEVNSHEDLLVVSNSSPIKTTASEISRAVESIQVVIHQHQPPEPVQHVEILQHVSLVRPSLPQQHLYTVPNMSSSQMAATSNHRPIITPTVQYRIQQPVNYSHHQQNNHQQLLPSHQQGHQQQQQINQYRIHSLGPQQTLQGEQISVYETVNFLDILNETKQQHAANAAAAAGTPFYHNLSFTK